MDTFRILALRHYLLLQSDQIRLILWVIDSHKEEVLNNIDLRYFACRGIPAVREELKNFKDVDKWLHDTGIFMYEKMKDDPFRRFGAKWDKLIRAIKFSLKIKQDEK